MKTRIRKAKEADAAAVVALYQALVGTAGCSWSVDYPTLEDVEDDLRGERLYLLCGENDEILGAAAAGLDAELDGLDCWNPNIRRPCGLARLGVAARCQGRGLARQLLRYIEDDAAARGFDGLRLLVSRTNPRALRLYQGLDYRKMGEAVLYELDWDCYEKKL